MSYYLIKALNSDMCLSIHKCLSDKGMDCKIVATPSILGRGCGLSVRVEDDAYKEIVDKVKNENLELNNLDIYKIEIKDNNKCEYTKI